MNPKQFREGGMTKQRLWQRTQIAAGHCSLCAQPRGIDGTGTLCRVHADRATQRFLARYHGHRRDPRWTVALVRTAAALSLRGMQ
jgi:hypothetical protein